MKECEFSLIERYFSQSQSDCPGVIAGIGDDAAILRLPAAHDLVVSIDTLNVGIHFSAHDCPQAIGHKTLAVSLSDMAAMGAQPAWATLALSLPEYNDDWLTAFSQGLFALAKQYGVVLVGGDTTRGSLSATLQIHGIVPEGTAIRRSGAVVGDDVYVTGTLGDAALALRLRQQGEESLARTAGLAESLDRPQPRVEFGQGLRGMASAAIDISDGLLADLGHLLAASHVGAELHLAELPLSAAFCCQTMTWTESQRWSCALAGGDDYELCFSAPRRYRQPLVSLAQQSGISLCRIGAIITGNELLCFNVDGSPYCHGELRGYDHFRNK